MNELGRLEDLPQAYLDALRAHHLLPLWPSLRGVMPAVRPSTRTVPTLWRYGDIRPLLMQAGTLTPIEKAERRVLVLANPGHGLDRMQASPAMYLGMQLLLPGEWAPAHRHTPNAVRMVIEGDGAYTTVEGERCEMKHGDLILTPTGLWHEHGHEGTAPVVWLDVLDLPLVYYLETSYHESGAAQRPAEDQAASSAAYQSAGLAPSKLLQRKSNHYPMLHYPYEKTRESLDRLAAKADGIASLTYINPESGSDALQILGFYALKLGPGKRCHLPAQSSAMILHTIEGRCDVRWSQAEQSELILGTIDFADTACLPGYVTIHLANPDTERACYLFLADESPLHRKLGLYETRA
jgi:gentisate 1,2-dioxygenase